MYCLGLMTVADGAQPPHVVEGLRTLGASRLVEIGSMGIRHRMRSLFRLNDGGGIG